MWLLLIFIVVWACHIFFTCFPVNWHLDCFCSFFDLLTLWQWTVSLCFRSFYVFLYFWLCWVLAASRRLSLAAARGALSLAAAGLSAVASLVAARGLSARRLQSLRRSPWSLPAPGIQPVSCGLRWHVGSQPLTPVTSRSSFSEVSWCLSLPGSFLRDSDTRVRSEAWGVMACK